MKTYAKMRRLCWIIYRFEEVSRYITDSSETFSITLTLDTNDRSVTQLRYKKTPLITVGTSITLHAAVYLPIAKISCQETVRLLD